MEDVGDEFRLIQHINDFILNWRTAQIYVRIFN